MTKFDTIMLLLNDYLAGIHSTKAVKCFLLFGIDYFDFFS